MRRHNVKFTQEFTVAIQKRHTASNRRSARECTEGNASTGNYC